jgi:ABC-type multidrug transport system fused ATPase/permease subunit
LERLDNGADASRTTSTILAGFDKFRLAIIGLFLVAILDVIVAWALWAFFDRIQHVVAVLAACCRGIYAVIFVVAITQPTIAARLLGDQQQRGLTDRGLQEQVAAKIQQFNDIWSVSLGLFGLHLLLIGWLAFTSGLVPRFIGVLVGIAGAGEVLLMVWLLIFAVRGPTQSHDHRQDDLRAAASSGSSGLGSRS